MISFGHLVLMRYGGTKQNCILWYPVRLYRRWINKVHAQIHKKRSNMIWYNRRWMCREVFSHISPPRFSQVFLVLMSSSLLSKTSNKTENDEWSLKVLERGTRKVKYPKYSKQCPYTVAHTIDCVCSKMLNHGLNHGLFLSLFKLFGWKYILNWINSE